MIADFLTSLLSDQISIDGIVFDAYLELNQTETVTVTSHPVQTGANISDHAYVNPREFDYLIGVTNSSMGKSLALLAIDIPLIGIDRSVSAYDYLVSMQRFRDPVTLHNKYGDYTVLITSVSVLDDYKTNDCLKARVHMKEVILAKSVSVVSELSSYIVEENNMGQQIANKQPKSNLRKIAGGVLWRK